MLKIEINEDEWYSNCCDAPPLYELEENSWTGIGKCMSCREGAIFYKQKKGK